MLLTEYFKGSREKTYFYYEIYDFNSATKIGIYTLKYLFPTTETDHG